MKIVCMPIDLWCLHRAIAHHTRYAIEHDARMTTATTNNENHKKDFEQMQRRNETRTKITTSEQTTYPTRPDERWKQKQKKICISKMIFILHMFDCFKSFHTHAHLNTAEWTRKPKRENETTKSTENTLIVANFGCVCVSSRRFIPFFSSVKWIKETTRSHLLVVVDRQHSKPSQLFFFSPKNRTSVDASLTSVLNGEKK